MSVLPDAAAGVSGAGALSVSEAPSTAPASGVPPPDAAADDGGTDALTSCGDGRVTGVEKCDIAIASELPGACPTSCPRLGPCNPRVLNGGGCQAECVLREVACESGDGCCLGQCNEDNDSDCAGRCGDGLVQESRGETCEPETSTPCLVRESDCDDGDECTVDALTGSALTCNAACTHTPIPPGKKDGCCPKGADHTRDEDCPPRCGNGVLETGEQCDGTEGCDDTCQMSTQTAGQRCASQAATACEKCACEKCPDTEIACRMSADGAVNRACGGILDCSQISKCADSNECYCGESVLCVVPPFGPCKDAIDRVSGGTDVNTALRQAMDPATILGRAYNADACRVDRCRDVCR